MERYGLIAFSLPGVVRAGTMSVGTQRMPRALAVSIYIGKYYDREENEYEEAQWITNSGLPASELRDALDEFIRNRQIEKQKSQTRRGGKKNHSPHPMPSAPDSGRQKKTVPER